MKRKDALTILFDIKGPLIQAPLGGDPATPELTAAVSNAGALGSFGAAYLSAKDMDLQISRIKELTQKAFAINLFIPGRRPAVSETQIKKACEVTEPYRAELGLPSPKIKLDPFESFEKQMEVVFKHRPRVFSFVFGLLSEDYIKECKAKNILVVGTATSLPEAEALQDSGVDAVVAQGVSTGGHRAMFAPDDVDPELGTEELTRTISGKLKIPVIASGGLMTGQDIKAALSWGADAAQLGTAFLLCPEAGTAKPYREALKAHRFAKSRSTRVYSGRIARGLENRFMTEMNLHPEAILPWPTQNGFTKDIRKKSAQNNTPDFLSLWAGDGLSQIREMSAGELVKTLFQELA